MEEKEKAYKLAMTFDREGETDNAKICALIACDEIINQFKEGANNLWVSGKIEYWRKVRDEIENL